MRNLSSLGDLEQDPNIPESWYSEPVPIPFCGGKAIRFYVQTAHPYPPDVEQAVRAFLALTGEDRLAASDRVFGHYRRSVEIIPDTDLGITEPAEVWKHVRPEGISVDRYDEGDGAVYVRVVYQCDWEEEHGLQIVLRGGTQVTLVGEHEGGSFVEDD